MGMGEDLFWEYLINWRLYFFLSCFILLKIKNLVVRLLEKKMICVVVEIFFG